MHLSSVSVFTDNYIWLLSADNQHCVIVDPGLAEPVVDRLRQLNWQPVAILLTHYHQDHTAGVKELIQHYDQMAVFGPEETAFFITEPAVFDNQWIQLGQLGFKVLSLPGHTAGHVAYYCEPYLFSGDVIFSAGCGRLFQPEAAKEMYLSLQRVAELPDETKICAAHEYTLQNLMFANNMLTNNREITAYLDYVNKLRIKNRSTLPSILKNERFINLFLRCHDVDLQKKIGITPSKEEVWRVFLELRRLKDLF